MFSPHTETLENTSRSLFPLSAQGTSESRRIVNWLEILKSVAVLPHQLVNGKEHPHPHQQS